MAAEDIAKPRRVTIDEQTYLLRPWEYKDARAWAWRLLQAMLRAAPGSTVDAAAIGAGIAEVEPEMFEAFATLCEKYTSLIGKDDQGAETQVPLSQIAATYMRRRLGTLVELVKLHVEIEFADFFARLGRVAAELARSQAEAKS